MSVCAGVTDHFAQDEPHALSITRNIFANLNLRRGSIGSVAGSNAQQVAVAAAGWDEPLYDPRELRGAVPPDSRWGRGGGRGWRHSGKVRGRGAVRADSVWGGGMRGGAGWDEPLYDPRELGGCAS